MEEMDEMDEADEMNEMDEMDEMQAKEECIGVSREKLQRVDRSSVFGILRRLYLGFRY